MLALLVPVQGLPAHRWAKPNAAEANSIVMRATTPTSIASFLILCSLLFVLGAGERALYTFAFAVSTSVNTIITACQSVTHPHRVCPWHLSRTPYRRTSENTCSRH